MGPTTAATMYAAETDTLPYAESTLRDGAGYPIQLQADDVVTFKYRRYDSDDPSQGGPAVIAAPGVPTTDPRCGQVNYVWPGPVPAPATYECQWKVVFADGKQAHFPNRGYDVLQVSAIIPDPV